MFMMSWRDRVGAAQLAGMDQKEIWMRATGADFNADSASGQLDTDSQSYTIRVGADLVHTDDNFTFGIMAGYGWNNNKTRSRVTDYRSRGDIDGYGLGAYASWNQNGKDNQGWYIDSWLNYGRYSAKVKGDDFDTERYKITSLQASLEAGYSFAVSSGEKSTFWLEPQAQVVWGKNSINRFVEQSGTIIDDHGHDLTSRLGVRATLEGKPNANGQFGAGFLQADWLRNWERGSMDLDGYRTDFWAKDQLQLKAGYEQHFSDRVSVNLTAAYQTGGGDNALIGAANLFYRF